MAGIDLATAEAHLQTWLDAESTVARGQSVAHGDRQLTRANLGEIREQIKFWQGQIDRLARGSRPTVQRMVLHG